MRISRDAYRRNWLAAVAVVVAALGMFGYVGGRLTRDPGLLPIEVVSTYLVLVGLALFAVLLFIRSARRDDALLPRLLAGTLVLWGIDFVAFPFERINAIPLGILAAAVIGLMAAAWKTLNQPEFWLGTGSPNPVERKGGR